MYVLQKWKSIYLYIFSSTKKATQIQKYPFCVTRGFFVYLPTFIPFHMYMCLTETAQTHTRLGATWNWNFPALDCGPCLPCLFFFFLIVVVVNKERDGEGVFSSFTFALSSSFFVYFSCSLPRKLVRNRDELFSVYRPVCKFSYSLALFSFSVRSLATIISLFLVWNEYMIFTVILNWNILCHKYRVNRII